MSTLHAELELEPADPSVRRARRFAEETLCAWGADAAVYLATLVVSELVTNAVIHARTRVRLILDRHDGGIVRVAVADDTPRLPQRKHYGLDAGTGRGLLMVERLSRSWGADPLPSGKVVWAELDEAAPPLAFDLNDADDLDG